MEDVHTHTQIPTHSYTHTHRFPHFMDDTSQILTYRLHWTTYTHTWTHTNSSIVYALKIQKKLIIPASSAPLHLYIYLHTDWLLYWLIITYRSLEYQIIERDAERAKEKKEKERRNAKALMTSSGKTVICMMTTGKL